MKHLNSIQRFKKLREYKVDDYVKFVETKNKNYDTTLMYKISKLYINMQTCMLKSGIRTVFTPLKNIRHVTPEEIKEYEADIAAKNYNL